MPTVFANFRSITHKGDGFVNVAAPPDVCKTPSPAGPIPIPYVNVAQDSNLAKGTKKVKVEGNPAALESSEISMSMGDEPGTAGGIISSKFKGKLTWKLYSFDVKFEGKGVVRFADLTMHNGNSFNTIFMQLGMPGVSLIIYGDDQDKCALCDKDKSEHKTAEENDQTKAKADELAGKLRSKSPGRGFMMGIVQCDCHPDIVVCAHSGTVPIPEFAEAAGSWVVANDKVHPGNLRNHKGKPKGKDTQKVAAVFKALKKKRNEGSTEDSFNFPGSCAAPKAINKCHELGLDPRYMTEQYFAESSGGSMAGEVAFDHHTTDATGDTPTTTTTQEKRTFSDGESVPSCGTCKVVVQMMLCTDEDPECSGKTE